MVKITNEFDLGFNALKEKEEYNKTLIASIKRVIDDLIGDQNPGNRIRRKQIPKYYVKKHNIYTLFVVKLPRAWRLTYATQHIENERSALVLEVFSHHAYEKRFGYSK